MDQAADDDLPDDFKVGVTVIDCDVEIRVAFIRKVYSILFVQLLATSLVALAMSLPAAIEFTHANPWTMWVPMLGSLVALFGVYWKRHEHPLNLVLLGLFTLLEAVMIGSVTSYYESRIVRDPPLEVRLPHELMSTRYCRRSLSLSVFSLA
jgi:FtsH-binding integral membrane protein